MADMEYELPDTGDAPEENGRTPVSIWRWLDIFAALAVVIFGFRFMMFPKFSVVFLMALFLIPVPLGIRQLYCKDKPRTTLFRAITGIIRTVLYSFAFGMLLAHRLLLIESPRLYHIQRSIYGTNARMDSFLPKELPSDIRDYRCTFIRAAFPGASRIELTFNTSAEEVEKLRQKAISAGASEKAENINVSRSSARDEIIGSGRISENAVQYYFPGGSEHFPLYYVLDSETGFVNIYF